MTERRGLKIGELMIGVVLSGVALRVLSYRYNEADPRILVSAIDDPRAKIDPSLWLCPAAVLTACLGLLAYFVASRTARGRTRVFFEGALGGWLFFILTLMPGVDYYLTNDFLPSKWCGEAADALTKYSFGMSQDDFGIG
jgi:hypothetical protein